MPVRINGVLVPPSESSQRASAEAKRRADSIGVHAAAEILGVDVRTLRRWHKDDVGPKRTSLKGKRPILYSRTEVQQFVAALSGKRLVGRETRASGHSEAVPVQTCSNGHSESTDTLALENKQFGDQLGADACNRTF